MIREALTGLGVEKLDVLINNAGRGPEPTPATEWNEGELDMAVDVFIKAPILLVKEFVPCMVPEGGRIVNMCVSLRSPVNMFRGARRWGGPRPRCSG